MNRRNYLGVNTCGCTNCDKRMQCTKGECSGHVLNQALAPPEEEVYITPEGETVKVTKEEIVPTKEAKAIPIIGAFAITGFMLGTFQVFWNMRGKKMYKA